MRMYFVGFGLTWVLGCSNPRNERLPTDVKTWSQNERLRKAIQKLPEPDKELLAAYAMRQGTASLFGAGSIPEGTTVEQAIETQRHWEAEQEKREAEGKLLAAKVNAEKEAQRRLMDSVLTAAVTHMEFIKSDFHAERYEDTIALELAFQNKSDRNLRGIKGAVRFSNMFGDHIKTINIALDDGIAAGKTLQWPGSVRYNQFRDEDRKLATTPLDKLKVEWLPTTYLFADGTSMNMPND